MVPFYEIAMPHRDILEGRLTREVFAAHLGQVFKGEGPIEYRDPILFWEKTYKTVGLNRLLSVVKDRLTGEGGDPVIQISTPFGGGKTHSLIAMYHEAREWEARTVVIVGTEIDAKKATLWGLLEKQLTGKIDRFKGGISPGSDALYELLSENQPVLILIDELLQYVTKAAGVKVGDSTRAAQTVAFMQELTEAVGILKKVSLVLTLPSSATEQFDVTAQRLYLQLQKVSGRVDQSYTPVADHEIAKVIRHRLFSNVDEGRASQVVDDFVRYARKESLLLPEETTEYRKRFKASYPFLPDTIDVLYQRWGSLPTFQRTRGVLRLLASIIHSLDGKPMPYISLADFDLSVSDIRQDLLDHIDEAFTGIIALDITGSDAGSKKVDAAFDDAYKGGFAAGSRSATAIFLYSFSGGKKQTGATLKEIKRNATTTESQTTPKYLSSVVGDAIVQLEGKLFHLEHDGNRFFFTTRANLNSILNTKMEVIEAEDISEFEDTLLKKYRSGGTLKTFVWRENGQAIPDDDELKLVILKTRDEDIMKQIIETKGKGHTPRENPNTLFFLTPREDEKMAFQRQLREILAYRAIKSDKTLNLSDAQEKKIEDDRKKAEGVLSTTLLRYYRTLFIPTKEEFIEFDLTPGGTTDLDKAVYEKLRAESVIFATYHPRRIRDEYLKANGNETISTETLYHTSAKIRGAPRVIGPDIWVLGIREGVKEGLFGLGKWDKENEKPKLLAFKEEPQTVSLSGDEVIIRADICRNLKKVEQLVPCQLYIDSEF